MIISATISDLNFLNNLSCYFFFCIKFNIFITFICFVPFFFWSHLLCSAIHSVNSQCLCVRFDCHFEWDCVSKSSQINCLVENQETTICPRLEFTEFRTKNDSPVQFPKISSSLLLSAFRACYVY